MMAAFSVGTCWVSKPPGAAPSLVLHNASVRIDSA